MSIQTSNKAKTAVLLVSSDLIGANMAGPGIRYYELGCVLHRHTRLTLAAPAGSVLPPGAPTGLHMITYERGEKGEHRLYNAARACTVMIVQGNLLYDFPRLKTLTSCIVVDLYDPFLLANIQFRKHQEMEERQYYNKLEIDIINEQLFLGDFFICGSEKQRDYWLGTLSTVGRINPANNDTDPSFRNLIDLTPFGLPQQPPQHRHPVLKGVHAGIAATDKVLIWGGGIWEWFDAPTLLRAMAAIVQQRQDVKLYFMGVKHPNPVIPTVRAVQVAIDLARELDLLDKYVFFNDWTPYEDRQDYLMEADLGVSLHLDHIETRFSLRTRIFDYIWASLPIVTTEGDSMSELVQQHDLGRVVGVADVEQVTNTILEMLDQPDLRLSFRAAFEKVQPEMTWEKVTQPLINYCLKPSHAADYIQSERTGLFGDLTSTSTGVPGGRAELSQESTKPAKNNQRQLSIYLQQLKKAENDYFETVSYTKQVEKAYNEKIQQLEQVNFLYQEAVSQRHYLEATLSSPFSLIKILALRVLGRFRKVVGR